MTMMMMMMMMMMIPPQRLQRQQQQQQQQRLLLLLVLVIQQQISVVTPFHTDSIHKNFDRPKSRGGTSATPWTLQYYPSATATTTTTSFRTISKATKKSNDFTTIIIDETKQENNEEDDNDEEEKRKKKKDNKTDDYEIRKKVWEDRYGSVEALRRSFGISPNSFWGDLDPESTRLLYHTLLPRSLLGLYEAGLMRPDELAPLAYQARKAAKEYARERSQLPGRIVAQAFDGFRSLRRNGRFKTMGITFQELWDKYEGQIVQEECRSEIDSHSGNKTCRIDQTALADRIYLRILERSCATNQAFDRLISKSKKRTTTSTTFVGGAATGTKQQQQQQQDQLPSLAAVSIQLENDVREILLNPKAAKRAIKFEEQQQKERRTNRKMQLLSAVKIQHDLNKAIRKREKESSKYNKKRQRTLQKALHKAAQRHRQQQQQQQQQQHQNKQQQPQQDQDDNVETDNENATATTTTIVVVDETTNTNTTTTTFDMTKQVDRIRRAYPILRIMARTRKHLES